MCAWDQNRELVQLNRSWKHVLISDILTALFDGPIGRLGAEMPHYLCHKVLGIHSLCKLLLDEMLGI